MVRCGGWSLWLGNGCRNCWNGIPVWPPLAVRLFFCVIGFPVRCIFSWKNRSPRDAATPCARAWRGRPTRRGASWKLTLSPTSSARASVRTTGKPGQKTPLPGCDGIVDLSQCHALQFRNVPILQPVKSCSAFAERVRLSSCSSFATETWITSVLRFFFSRLFEGVLMISTVCEFSPECTHTPSSL